MSNKRYMPMDSVIMILFAMMMLPCAIFFNIIHLSLNVKIGAILLLAVAVYFYIIKTLVKSVGLASFVTLFVLLSTVFYFGEHIVAVFDPAYLLNHQDYHILDGRLSDERIVSASFLVLAFLLIMCSGYIYNNRTIRSERNAIRWSDRAFKTVDRSSQSFVIVGCIFLAISIVPAFLEVLAQYKLSMNYNYQARRALESDANYLSILGISYVQILIADWFLPAIYMLLLACKGKKRILLYGLVAAYSSVYLLTGSRFTLLKTAVSLFLIEFVWYRRLQRKQMRKIGVICIIAIVLLSVFSTLRGMSSISFDNFMDYFSNYMDESPISATLWETGITFTTVSNVMDKCPSIVNFAYGKSYYGGLLICLPKFMRLGIVDRYTFTISSIFSPLYYHTKAFGYGSSIIAEAYYNLGYLLLCFAFIFGGAIGRIESKAKKQLERKNLYGFFLSVCLFGELIYSVRNDIYAIPRTMMLSAILPAICAKGVELIANTKKTHGN